MKPRPTVGLICPTDPTHGPLLEVDGRLRCVHQGHDGRPSTHPLGAAAMTRSLFTLDEAIRPASAASDHAGISTAAESGAAPVAGATGTVPGALGPARGVGHRQLAEAST